MRAAGKNLIARTAKTEPVALVYPVKVKPHKRAQSVLAQPVVQKKAAMRVNHLTQKAQVHSETAAVIHLAALEAVNKDNDEYNN